MVTTTYTFKPILPRIRTKCYQHKLKMPPSMPQYSVAWMETFFSSYLLYAQKMVSEAQKIENERQKSVDLNPCCNGIWSRSYCL